MHAYPSQGQPSLLSHFNISKRPYSQAFLKSSASSSNHFWAFSHCKVSSWFPSAAKKRKKSKAETNKEEEAKKKKTHLQTW